MAFISHGLPLRRASSRLPTRQLAAVRCVASPPDDTKDTGVSKSQIRAARIITPDSAPSKQHPETPPPQPPPTPPTPPPGPEWARTLAGFAAAISLIVLLSTATGGGLENESNDSVLQMVSDFLFGPRFLISAGMGLSAFIQALTGFGFAIVSVSCLRSCHLSSIVVLTLFV